MPGMTGTADFIVQTSNLVAGSTVTGTANGDTIALVLRIALPIMVVVVMTVLPQSPLL